jgi:CheY-like chemotaxis protein
MSDAPLVLVVEDDPQMLRLLTVLLEGNGLRVIAAKNAADGETMAATYGPEVIILDLGLPDRDGLELTRKLREWTATPIVVVSARGREGDKVQALDHGADVILGHAQSLAGTTSRGRQSHYERPQEAIKMVCAPSVQGDVPDSVVAVAEVRGTADAG